MAPPLQDHPLFLPELLSIVVSLLQHDKPSVLSCLRTSKDFRNAFAPVIWRDVFLPSRTTKSARKIAPKSVRNYAPYISSLTFREDAADCYAFKSLICPKLTKLQLWTSRGHLKQWIQNLSDVPETLVRLHCGTLQELYLSGFMFWSEDIKFWTTVGTVTGLKSLRVNNSYFYDKESMQAFWDACTKESLERLHLEKTGLVTPVQGAWAPSKQLQHVTFQEISANTPKGLTDLISNLLGNASGLVSLVLTNIDQEVVFNELRPLLQRSRNLWPVLSRLDMNPPENVTDNELDEIIRTLPTSIMTLNCRNLGPRSFRAMIDMYSSTMNRLDLSRYQNLSSSDIRRVLWECKNLVSLTSGSSYSIQISDVITSSWVCCGLQEWDLGILNDAEDPAKGGREIFRRLAQMPKLTSLQILSISQQGQGLLLSPRLVQGLDELAPLKKLKRFDFDGRTMSQRDWHWILKTFRGLENVSCWIDRNDDLQQKFLAELRKTYGVQIKEFLV